MNVLMSMVGMSALAATDNEKAVEPSDLLGRPL